MLVGVASQLLRRTLVPSGCRKIAAASQPLRRTWRDYRMDEAVAAADKSAQQLNVDVAPRQVFQHPATDWKGPKKQPQIHLKHKIPLMIETWKDFVPDTVTFWAGHPPALSASTALTVRNEADSAKQFQIAVVDPVSDVVDPGGRNAWRRLGGSMPNFEAYKVMMSGSQPRLHQPSAIRQPSADFELCDASDVIKGVGEFKYHTVCNLAASEDLVKGLQAYCPEGPRDPKLRDDIPKGSLAFEKELYRFYAALCQVSWYAYVYKTWWGFLSTGQNTVFLHYRVVDGLMHVEVSPPFACNTGNSGLTVGQGLLMLTQLASDDQSSGPSPAILEATNLPKEATVEDTSFGMGPLFTPDSLSLGSVLGRGSSGLVREGQLNGKLVAVKTPSLEDAHHSSESSYEDSCDSLEEELDVYLAIASLPGKAAVPALEKWGILEEKTGRHPAIITSKVEGAPLPKDVAPTPDMVDAVILAARSLHKLHITHGDLAPRNIIVQGGLPGNTAQATLVDLGNAHINASDADMAAELAALKCMLTSMGSMRAPTLCAKCT